MGTLDDLAAEGAVSEDTMSAIREGYGGLLEDLDASYSVGKVMSLGDLLAYQYLLNEWPRRQSDAPPKPSGSPPPPMAMGLKKRSSSGGRSPGGGGGGGGGGKTRRDESGWNHSRENEHSSGGAGFGPSGGDDAKCRHCKTPGSCADFGCRYAELLASIEARKKARDQHIAGRVSRAAAERARIAAAAHARNIGWGS